MQNICKNCMEQRKLELIGVDIDSIIVGGNFYITDVRLEKKEINKII